MPNPYDQFDANPYDQFDEEPRSFGQEVGRQAGLAGRAVVNAFAGIPLAAAEAGAGIGNIARGLANGRGLAAFTDPAEYSPTRDFESLLNRVAPQPETSLESGVQFAGTAIAGLKAPGLPASVPVPAPANGASRVIAEGAKRGVPVYYDDVGGAMARRVGVAAEPLGPLGTGSGRAVQAEAAKLAAGEFVKDRLPSVGDDVPVLVQKSLKEQLGKFRTAAGRLYDRADSLMAGRPVNVAGYQQVIDDQLAKLSQLGPVADQGTVSILQRFKSAPAGDFAHMRQLRSALGDEIADYYSGKGAIGQKGVGALQAAKDALDADLAAHARGIGGDALRAWKAADGFYKQRIIPFKEAGFKELVNTAEPEKSWKYLLASRGLESRAARMYQSLTREGRGVVRYGMVKDALDNSTDSKGVFSPAKFAKYIEDHDKVIATFFRGREKSEIDGFSNLMRHVERAGQFAENPPTGQRVIPYIVGGAAVFEPTSAALVAGGGLSVRALFQTESGRNMLLKAAQLKPGTPEMAELEKAIARYVASSTAAARPTFGGQERPTQEQRQ